MIYHENIVCVCRSMRVTRVLCRSVLVDPVSKSSSLSCVLNTQRTCVCTHPLVSQTLTVVTKRAVYAFRPHLTHIHARAQAHIPYTYAFILPLIYTRTYKCVRSVRALTQMHPLFSTYPNACTLAHTVTIVRTQRWRRPRKTARGW